MNEKTHVIFRWSFLIPGSILGSWLAWFIIFYHSRWVVSKFDFDETSFFFRMYIEGFSAFAMGAGFVYSGFKIAPTRKKITSYCLALFSIFFAGIAFFAAFIVGNTWSLFSSVFMPIGSIFIAYKIYLEEIISDEKNPHSL